MQSTVISDERNTAARTYIGEDDNKSVITEDSICSFEQFLKDNEKSPATIDKYISSTRRLMVWMDGREISRELLMEYRDAMKKDHAASTVNGALSAINSYLEFIGLPQCRLRLLKIQKKVFRSEDRELTRKEYNKLIKTAGRLGKKRLLIIIETICSTGIRVSELEFITVESLESGTSEVTLKGKTRTIFLTKKLIKKLRMYARAQKITSGSIFLTRNGTPISRKQIWAEMKALSEEAGVKATQVFPHNLRHLFARCYYKKTHDIVKLSDLLGHSSVETTRIYLMSTGSEQAKELESMDLVS